jgi:heptose-I-phosphate ethanolaminephosphotransferase
MASAADEAVFINMTSSDMVTPYDGELLKPFEKALNEDYPKKVIFLHLQGNRLDYSKRYPEQFQVFRTLDDKYQDIEDVIDAYDNATIYNDYILNDIIEKLKTKNDQSFMLYFSNHGEEVYETQDNYGHSEEDASKPMYDIPFILWQSEAFKESRPIRFRPYRKYMTDDLLHSVGHLANIKYDAYEAERSVFSIYFKNRTRYIQGDVDYDKLFE